MFVTKELFDEMVLKIYRKWFKVGRFGKSLPCQASRNGFSRRRDDVPYY